MSYFGPNRKQLYVSFTMKNVIQKGWRDSASLIVLNKRHGDLPHSCNRRAVKYDVLLQTRPSKGSFPNSVVFPGGVSEVADGSDHWLKLIKSFGYNNDDFASLHCAGTPTSPIFQPNPIERHVALRVTAIRETFEELGLLLCSWEHKNKRGDLFASAVTDVDVNFWQKRIAKDPAELFTLCKEHNCYPDIWSLYYWSNWLTPNNAPKRFSTAFFVSALNQQVEIKSNKEVVKVQWSSASEILQRNINGELELYPPQIYELIRLTHLPDIGELLKFAKQRSGYCDELIYPIIVKAKDGLLCVYPGDDLYPSDIDYHHDEIVLKHKTVSELNDESRVTHRLSLVDLNTRKWLLVMKNYKPNNHIDMGDKTYQTSSEIYL